MADKNFQMQQRNTTNTDWDKLYPITKPENVKSSTGIIAAIPHLGTTTNNGNDYSVSTSEPIAVNQKFTLKFNAASTGAPTLNVSSIGSKKGIKKLGGTDAKIKVGVYTVFYDGENFQLLGEGGDGTAIPSEVLAGKTFTNDIGDQIGTMPNQGTKTSTITMQGGQYTIPEGYHNGNGKITASFANLSPSNIKSGVNIGGVIGSLTELKQASGSGSIYKAYNANETFSITGFDFTPRIVIVGSLATSGENLATSAAMFLGGVKQSYWKNSGTIINSVGFGSISVTAEARGIDTSYYTFYYYWWACE